MFNNKKLIIGLILVTLTSLIYTYYNTVIEKDFIIIDYVPETII